MSESLQDQWSGKRVTVMGLGLHGGGLAVATWMLRHGACVTVTDLKSTRELREPVATLRRIVRERGSGTLALVLGQHRARDFRDADLIVQNPGVPRKSKYLAIARAARVPIENEASLFLKIVRSSSFLPFTTRGGVRRGAGQGVRIIGVTGTRGKSTTAALIHAMLRQAGRTAFLAGNIRIPMFDVLDRVIATSRRNPVDVVLELSSWHCELLSTATGGPDVAVLTNLYPDHLNRYSSMRSYAAAKSRIVRFQDRRGIVVANAEQSVTRAMAALTSGSVIWFASRAPRRLWSGFTVREMECIRLRRGRATVIAPRALLRLPGVHNTMNLLAATAAVTVCGVRPLDIRRALRSFRGLSGRLETVAQHRGVTFVNDTCATSPDGAIAALRALRNPPPHAPPPGGKGGNQKQFLPLTSGGGARVRRSLGEGGRGGGAAEHANIILIAGGTDKELEFAAWAKEVVNSVKTIIFLPGTATEKMKIALHPFIANRPSLIVRDASSMRAAVRLATASAHPGDTVLLSPGAASFGLFQHEFDRGDQFTHAVRALHI